MLLLRDTRGRTVGAELRGTTAEAGRGMAPESRDDVGFFAIPTAPLDGTVLSESAIDALSCHALKPGDRCLSTARARANPAWLEDLARQTRHLLCG